MVSPVIYMRRTALKDAEIDGQKIAEGEKVMMYYGAANRDPAVFDNPDALDIARANADKHIAFGYGPHVCLGKRVAQIQLEEAYRQLLDAPAGHRMDGRNRHRAEQFRPRHPQTWSAVSRRRHRQTEIRANRIERHGRMALGEIVSGARRLTTADMTERSARAATGLDSLGIGPGDIIALYLRNDFAFFEASTAAGLLGAYPTPVNWHCTPDEARYIFENSGAKAIVDPCRSAARDPRRDPGGRAVLVVPTPPEIATPMASRRSVRSAGGHAGLVDLARGLRALCSAPRAPAAGTMIYTSGTTGHPKGVRRAPPTPEQ